MDKQLNTIIKYFTRSCIQFSDLFITSLPSYEHDTARRTAPYCSGLIFTLDGEAQFSLDGVPYIVNKHTMLHAGPSMLIDIQTTKNSDWKYVVIHYTNHCEIEMLSNQHFKVDIGDNHKIAYFLQRIIQLNNIPGDLMHLKCQVYLFQLLETILLNAKIQKANNFVDQAIIYISQNYEQPISINEIAEAIGYDRRKFSYAFEKQIGMSPIQYLIEYRLKQAKLLLRSTKLTIKEIAELVGYTDPYYFCRIFKKKYALTPTAYRKFS